MLITYRRTRTLATAFLSVRITLNGTLILLRNPVARS